MVWDVLSSRVAITLKAIYLKRERQCPANILSTYRSRVVSMLKERSCISHMASKRKPAISPRILHRPLTAHFVAQTTSGHTQLFTCQDTPKQAVLKCEAFVSYSLYTCL